MELPDRKDYSQSIVDPETGELVQVHDSEGREIPDPVPMAPPLGYNRPLSMFDHQRNMVRAEHERLRMLELDELRETPDQANDFEIDEDIENTASLYEEKFDPVSFEVRSRLRQAEFAASVNAAVDGLPPQQKELLDGNSLNDRPIKRGSRDVEARSGESDSVGKGDTKPVKAAADNRSVSKDDKDVSGA